MTELKSPLQLREYALLELRAKTWPPEKDLQGVSPSIKSPSTPLVDFEAVKHPDEPYSWLLNLKVGAQQDLGENGRYEVFAEILGDFEFTPDYSVDEMHQAVVLNGGLILYGLLRGLIGGVTGSFPFGKFILPPVYFQKIAAEKYAQETLLADSEVEKKRRAPRRNKTPT